jgi:glyoxylase-like metal-dependent hydrolase (beta-lactamase superfamily II)
MGIEHIKRWQIGDVEVVRIVQLDADRSDSADLFEGGAGDLVRMHSDWLAPRFATPDGDILMSYQAFGIKTRGRTLLVDTCIGDDKERRQPLFHRRQSTFVEDLAAAGFAPDTVDTVLCTHLHVDHVGWNTRLVDGAWIPTFPNARYLFNHAEWDFLSGLAQDSAGEADHLADSLDPIVAAGLADFVETSHRVTDEVWLDPTPGHTPGHVAVRIASRGQEAVITGDLIHHPLQCAEPDIRTNFCVDHEQARLTRRDFLHRCEIEGTLVIGTHFCEPTAGLVVREGPAWRFSV